ncbi:hypothetical protein BCR32DRAFT_250074 [Anaeromyces robustus]|uniref:Uncharacterized protein n=1 Tax=Anaeromyces robustus TaxID=1754192 RepID=A0A1Y1WDY0_9FUNG|nr:hypothetical protein BCR32DRAFT_250074 [Anaeromyces robustus]|eukprot:ORX71731.1 hypothetical protein BCR32DRAFT_250074 [Anaeromyces robustus]
MNLANLFNYIYKLPLYIFKTYIVISLLSINPSNSISKNDNKSYNSYKRNFGISLTKAFFTSTYFDFSSYDRVLSISNFGYEKGGEIIIRLDEVVLQFQNRRFRTYSNYTFFQDLYIGVCETQKWLDFLRENDNDKNYPYYVNSTYYGESNNNTETINTNNKARSIDNTIIGEIINSGFLNNENIISIKTLMNTTESVQIINKNSTYGKTTVKVGDFVNNFQIFQFEQYNGDPKIYDIDKNTINDIQRSLDDQYYYSENTYELDDDNIINNSTESNNDDNDVYIVDRFLDLLIESNIYVNLTSFYDLAVDSESYKFQMKIPKDGHYTIFMLKTKSLVSMGFDGDITVLLKNPYKYPHFSTDQYNLIKEHSLILGIWMILFLLWICTWIKKIKVELPLAKLLSFFPLINIIILGLEIIKYQYYGKNGDYSVLVVLSLGILLMLRTAAFCFGVLYFSKGMYIVRIMMIPDENRSILAVTAFTALTDAIFVGLGEGSSIAMVVFKILLYMLMYKNYIHHIYVLWKYLRKIKEDYSKEYSKTFEKSDDRLTKMTYDELRRLISPDACYSPNQNITSSPIRFSTRSSESKSNTAKFNDEPPPIPVRSASLNRTPNSHDPQIPNKVFNHSLNIENNKSSPPIPNINNNSINNQWNTSENPKISSPSGIQSNSLNDKKDKKIENNEFMKSRKIISIEENTLLYSQILIESYKNKLSLLIKLFVVSIVMSLVDLTCRALLLPYYYDDDYLFYLIYESFFIFVFIIYGILLYPKVPKNYIWVPKWVIENTTQPISDIDLEFMN